ncbi:HAMP domain-containing sensor histidine kinase [Clostridium sp. Marseille-P299]|uniref:HAMP domain-containing sensor histidine kinase n=1 Tax=Clostridium sp. Marseille-P299 TaxID=1805477 RepID=UPI000829D099|nr:HAMP domain-containing sensor histidine kinase [Clostridium sp. Marseille-P299]
MKKRVLIKLVVLYLIAALSMFFLLNTFGRNLMQENLIEKKKEALYSEASLIVSEYASQYYNEQMSLTDMLKQLRTVDSFLKTRIWIVDNNGEVIADTKSNAQGININEIDETYLEQTYAKNVYFKGIFSEPMLSVIVRIPYNYSVKGYVCIHTSMEGIKGDSVNYVDFINICYLIFLLILLLIFMIIYYITVIPVERMIKATKEYSSGNFDYPIKVYSHDEYRDLANTIRYMADELKNLDDYQKKFVANISHDFRSPLTSIKGYAEAMLDGTISYEMQGKYLDIILFEAERLTKLTTNLLALNSFENNGTILDITSFDINKVIRKTAATFEGQCTKKKIMLNLIFSSMEIYVDADVDKIQQVLYNLIDNAIKFSNPESTIKVSVEEKGSKVFISIKDHGIGIPKDSIKKIWERFYKTDTSRGKDKKGTGLGLSITKEILLAHNENINVISTEGVGTEFIFTLHRSDI